MFSPVAGIVFAWHTIKMKGSDPFEKSLKWMTAGTLIFFFIMTFKGRGEANWVAFALIPAFIVGYKQCELKEWFPGFTRRSFPVSLLLIGIIRLYLVYDFLPDNKTFAYAKVILHHTKQWAEEIQKYAGERPVAFMNKYQYAAWYEFYTGQPAISLNNRMGRKNQYNIWDDEKNLQGKDVMLVPNYEVQGMEGFNTGKGEFQYAYIDNFRSPSRISIIPTEKELELAPGEKKNINFAITTKDSTWTLAGNPGFVAQVHSILFKKGKMITDKQEDFFVEDNMAGDGELYTISIQAPEEKGTYNLYLDIAVGWLPPGINGEQITIKVK